jgi:hypothetical protein
MVPKPIEGDAADHDRHDGEIEVAVAQPGVAGSFDQRTRCGSGAF